jgi:hypothetical protein
MRNTEFAGLSSWALPSLPQEIDLFMFGGFSSINDKSTADPERASGFVA